MDKKLNDNMDALLAYGNTKHFRVVWGERLDIELNKNWAEKYLEDFNAFANNLVEPTDKNIATLMSIMDMDKLIILYAERGEERILPIIKRQLLENNIELNDNIESGIKEKFIIDETTYNLFFEKATKSYENSYLYKIRLCERGEESAKLGLSDHIMTVGEVFNKLIAHDYVQTLKNKNVDEVPENFKKTLSGMEYLKQFEPEPPPKINILENIENLRNKFFSKFKDKDLKP